MRRAGILLHPTALPGSPLCGSLGAAAHRWVELLADHGIQAWQLLPLAPPDGTGSPYSSPSGFAISPWLLDAEQLLAEAWLEPADLEQLPAPPAGHQQDLQALPERVMRLAEALLERSASWSPNRLASFEQWRLQQADWLVDHSRFMVLRQRYGQQPWWQWPAPLARRSRRALAALDQQEAPALRREALVQWLLQRQWQQLRDQASARGVQLVGDLPFYVAHDSADVWSHQRLFSLRRDGRLCLQSGVPPDYFSATGQLWGTPVYRWRWHRLSRFRWWRRRLQRQLALFDLLRLDHFRALEAAWWVPGADRTAEHGQWCPSPGRALLDLWRRDHGGSLPLIAEDLGVITPGVEALRDRHQLPGMKILQFAFDGNPANPYLPDNYRGSHWVVYTGTHDNATCIGWWQGLNEAQRQQVEHCLGVSVQAPGWQLLELALRSRADLAVVPLQDLLELGDEARFNTPGTCQGNWQWRYAGDLEALAGPLQGFGEMARRYGRGS